MATPSSAVGYYLAVDVTDTVKSWVATPATNFGLAIEADAAAPSTSVLLDSKENGSISHPAFIDISLTGAGAEGPTGATGATGPVGATGPTGPAGTSGTSVFSANGTALSGAKIVTGTTSTIATSSTVTVTFSSLYNNTPNCTATAIHNATTAGVVIKITAVSASSVTFQNTNTVNTAPASYICVGN